MESLVAELKRELAKAREGGAGRARHLEQKKMLVRDRIDALLDPGSPFLELSPLAAHGMYDGDAPGGRDRDRGRARSPAARCMIVANDATVKGGTYYPITVKKHLRAQEIARAEPAAVRLPRGLGRRVPAAAGGRLPRREHFGRIFYNEARMSAPAIPQIAAVMGSCTAGGAYVPAMADEAVIVKGTGTIFLAGPPLVKAATGEDVTAEELGGADVHTRISGVADYSPRTTPTRSRLDALDRRSLNTSKTLPADREAPEDPAYDPREIYGVIPADARKPTTSAR
jgi:acetyl-CoA carboxylase carboxyltransferase component